MTLRDFLGARYTEDETFFRAAAGDEDHQDWAFNQVGDLNEGALVWAALRFLDEITAHRRILAEHWLLVDVKAEDYCATCVADLGESAHARWPCPTLRALGSVYAEHEDFRPEWAL